MTDTRERAVALKYDNVDQLPHVVASGVGELAKQIVRLAKEHEVPLRQDQTLVDLLSKVDIGHPISEETYRLVAELICFLYQTDLEFRNSHTSLGSVIEDPTPKLHKQK